MNTTKLLPAVHPLEAEAEVNKWMSSRDLSSDAVTKEWV